MTATDGAAPAPRRRRLLEFLARPAEPQPPLFLDLRRLAVFLFALLVVTGALLSIYYRPSSDGARVWCRSRTPCTSDGSCGASTA
jgi:quinol-cytochrome oxidoreductase complex cytochrome b subunit